jgi:hypothetical protein
MSLRLPFEFIPAPCRGRNLHALLPAEAWDAIRRRVYRQANYCCEACSAAGVPLQANERWAYDDERQIQRLVGLTCLCEPCHAVAHSNWPSAPMRERACLTQTELRAHFCRVNRCTEVRYGRLRSQALAQCLERSRQGPWITEYGPYASLVQAWQPCQPATSL